MPGIRWRLHLLDLAFGVAETIAVVWPLYVFFNWSPALLRVAGLLFCGGALLWAGVLSRWFQPLDAAVEIARAPAARPGHGPGDPDPWDTRVAAYRAIVFSGWRSLWLRVVMVIVGSLVLGGVAVFWLGLPPPALLVALWSAALYTPVIDAFRALLYERQLRGLLPRLSGNQEPLRHLVDTYHGRMVMVALCTGAPAMLTVLVVTRFFVPLSPFQALRVQVLYPPVAVALLGLWGVWVWRQTRPIDQYLLTLLSSGPGGSQGFGPGAAEVHAAKVYRSAQLLPYLMGLSKVVLWFSGALCWGLLTTQAWSIDFESTVLLFGETVLVAVGAALYEILWHRAILAPLLAHLAVRLHGSLPVRTPLSLRTKMLVAFGTLTLFACGLSLFWSVMQYKTLAIHYTQWLNRLRLDELIADLRDHPVSTEAALLPLLQRHARNEVWIYYNPPHSGEILSFAGQGSATGNGTAQALSAEGKSALQGRGHGERVLPAPALTGSYAPLYAPRGPRASGPGGALSDLGAVMVTQPCYREGDLDTETHVLLGFFVLLLLGSMGVVVLAAADLTRPLRELELRAEAIARGDLGRPAGQVVVEADEVGRLHHAFEEMRHALSERFRSSTEIHFALEAQVARRTAELERRNRELKEALEALQHVQTELLHAEKMASMGRLVAGIAHEINNPVNAVVNTAGPLGEALGELQDLLQRKGGDPEDSECRAALGAAVADMRDMLRVVQRGARRTKEIVQALHHYSRGDGGSPAPVDLQRCLDDSLDLLRHYLKQGITVERDDRPLGPVVGYAGQLQQVFMNLLTNAAQALGPQGAAAGPAPMIRITTCQEGDRAIVRIADNGPGIPKDVLPRIFDPFFTTKDVGQGSGLGLSIVHSIVERHGGTITVATEVGQGTSFTVSLPLSGAAASSGEAPSKKPAGTP